MNKPQIPWLQPSEAFPPADLAWGPHDPAPGLLAAGGSLDSETLVRAYRSGIFPWFSHNQPVLWWSPDPRMVLPVAEFRLHRSLRKTLQRFAGDPSCEIRVDHDFHAVISACAGTPRHGQSGTWILPAMVQAYQVLHARGFAHSIETWIDGQLAGGLYLVAMGQAVFGESMFSHRSDASKVALAALVAICRAHGVAVIDCQQNTSHLASLGAREIPRSVFLREVAQRCDARPLAWHFEPVYWKHILNAQPSA